MATELYLNPDNTVGGLDSGQVMVAPTQEEFEDCCCAVPPCEGCATVQPDAVISFVSDGCDVECADLLSPLPYNSGVPGEGGCVWKWSAYGEENNFYNLLIYYCSDGRFYAIASHQRLGTYYSIFGGTQTPPCEPSSDDRYKDITGLVSCNSETGELEGAFTLDGLHFDYTRYDCTGCSINVTLGG